MIQESFPLRMILSLLLPYFWREMRESANTIWLWRVQIKVEASMGERKGGENKRKKKKKNKVNRREKKSFKERVKHERVNKIQESSYLSLFSSKYINLTYS